MGDTRPIPCSILRGGTSRGIFFRESDLPRDRAVIERVLLNVLGSPDARQINGLGGATSLTSKAAIIGPPSRTDADVDYTFAQVSVAHPVVDWGGNCGNISSAVGPFAINTGLVTAREPETVVRIHNTNTSKIIVATVPVVGGRAAAGGDYAVPGVPGTGAKITLEFSEPGGSATGKLLPTGKARDTLVLGNGRRLAVSVVDAANPVVFVSAAELGLTGAELPPDVELRSDICAILEEVRGTVAEWLGIVVDRRDATRLSPGLPKVAFVAPPLDYETVTGEAVAAGSSDLTGRFMSMQTPHRSYPITGTVCTCAAASVEGSVVHDAARPESERPSPSALRIAHPGGVIEAEVRALKEGAVPTILGVSIGRTARHIMDGQVHVPEECFAPVGREVGTVRG